MCAVVARDLQVEVLVDALNAERTERSQEVKALHDHIKEVQAERDALSIKVANLEISNQAAKKLAARLAKAMPASPVYTPTPSRSGSGRWSVVSQASGELVRQASGGLRSALRRSASSGRVHVQDEWRPPVGASEAMLATRYGEPKGNAGAGRTNQSSARAGRTNQSSALCVIM